MSEFTKGPWKIRRSGSGRPYQIEDEAGLGVTQWRGIARPASDEGEANARLIASAPCLLSALIAITNSGPDAIPIKEAFEMAHRAIERATSNG